METHEIEGVWAKGIPGCEWLGKKRGIGGKCGGIAIYIREGIVGTGINKEKRYNSRMGEVRGLQWERVEMVLGGERSSVGVAYMGRQVVDRTWYDTIMDWLKGRDLQQRGWTAGFLSHHQLHFRLSDGSCDHWSTRDCHRLNYRNLDQLLNDIKSIWLCQLWMVKKDWMIVSFLKIYPVCIYSETSCLDLKDDEHNIQTRL